jgi:hypothetical protein
MIYSNLQVTLTSSSWSNDGAQSSLVTLVKDKM